ncbi:hypothetical protein [Candidatus Clostridium helianthi]|uniref:Uncharacterized protein n=1 Tax=Candidatus Clostridium helianthi TaxID=3381660 RepID=A0ABW8SCJ4_9CLOT
MCNLSININNNFEGDKVKSSINLLKGKDKSDTQNGAMCFGFIIKISKKVLKDIKILRYINNLMINEKVNISVNLNQTDVEINGAYINHMHVNTISELNSRVEDNIKLAGKVLNVFQIYEYEVISIFYTGNTSLEIEELRI